MSFCRPSKKFARRCTRYCGFNCREQITMLDLNAFYHLPPLDALLAEIAREDAGMVIVAGMEPRASIESAENGALASGKTLVYGILARQILHAHPRKRNRVKHFFPKNDETYHALVQQAARLGYPLLFTEKLTRECIAPALHAAKNGQRILTQLDTPLRGAWVARYIRDAVGDDASAQSLRWVIAVQRLRRLCDDCKQRDGEFFRAVGCPACDQRGYRGEISSFDIWRNATAEDWLSLSSALSIVTYAHELAQQGFLAAADARDFEAAQLYRTIHLLTASEQDTAQATQSLRLQVTELELAKRA